MDRDQRTLASFSSLIAADTLKEAQNYSTILNVSVFEKVNKK